MSLANLELMLDRMEAFTVIRTLQYAERCGEVEVAAAIRRNMQRRGLSVDVHA